METNLPILANSVEPVTMGAPKLKPLPVTVDEYLASERAAEERHIYLDGQVFAMAGESLAHGIITVNLVISVGSQLKGTSCQALTKDTKVRSRLSPMPGHSTKGMFSYPDIVVVCGEVEFHDAYQDVIVNPKTIMEVLSESTEAFDRGEKFARFQTCNPTLTDYVLISQTKPQVEHYQRQPDGKWSYALYAGLKESVVLSSISCTLKLADVYDRVEFGEGQG
jgi:Uma2 family endonuclease